MKKILLVLFALISLNAFAQLHVKEGSFKHVAGGIIEDKEEYTDGNEMPMALIKISTENIPEQERLRLVFTGNRETQIIKRPKTGQMWIYLSAEAATFIDIKHPDYGTYKYFLPERLCDYCVYEMVLQYVNAVPEMKTGVLIVVSEPLEADVYIDGKYSGKTVKVITDIAVGTHELEISKQGYYSVKKTVAIAAGETVNINETLQIKKISISTDQSGDKQEHNGHEYVDLGLSVKWANYNVGADKPEEYGDYFAWGEITTKTNYSSDNCKTYGLTNSQLQTQGYIDGEGNLTAQYDAAAANWGGNWRMPTKAEYDELLNNCTWTWTTQNSVNGCKVTSKTNGNSIFLPATGYYCDGASLYFPLCGYYWCSTPDENHIGCAYILHSNSSFQCAISCARSGYLAVRPVIE